MKLRHTAVLALAGWLARFGFAIPGGMPPEACHRLSEQGNEPDHLWLVVLRD
jgi:hypothetical protein